MNPRERFYPLDYVRVFSMLSVIVIHVTSTFIYQPSGITLGGMNLALLLNQATRFAVPLFILLSGTSLGFRAEPISYGRFLKTRVLKILIPYLFWSLVYCGISYLKGTFPPEGVNVPLYFIESLLLGNFASHLYFIVVIFQLYLLYPLLKKGMERRPGALLIGSFFLSFFLQQIMYFVSFGVNLTPVMLRPYLWKSFPTWIFFFVLGMYLTGERLQKLCDFGKRHLPLLLPLTLLFALTFSYEGYLTGALDAIKPELFLYVPLVLLTLLGLGQRLSVYGVCNKVFGFLAKHSQTVFFSHLVALDYLRWLKRFLHGMQAMVQMLLLEIILAILLAWVFDSVMSLLKQLMTRKKTG